MFKYILVASLILTIASSASLTGANNKFILFQQFSDNNCATSVSTFFAWEIGTCNEFTIGAAAGSKIEVVSDKLALKAFGSATCSGTSN